MKTINVSSEYLNDLNTIINSIGDDIVSIKSELNDDSFDVTIAVRHGDEVVDKYFSFKL